MAVGVGATREAPDELLSFRVDGHGLDVADHVERRHVAIETPATVTPTPVDEDVFEFPVDRGVAIETPRVQIPTVMGAYVRNSLGFMVAEVMNGDERAFPHDRYSVELPAPIKLYLTFEGSPHVTTAADGVTIEFGGTVRVNVGARSHHKRPAASVTVTEDPADLLAAVSTFGSALKTTTCERSYPTLRGHPPTVRFGETLSIPSVLSTPSTGVTIEVPPEHRFAYVVASLAYYLGAEVVPGDAPRLRTDAGFLHSLGDEATAFETAVERTLKRTFFMDCLTRTEGLYQVDLHERNVVEDALDVSFPALYEQPLARQLETYLDVPYDLLEPHLPEWKLTAHVEPVAEHAETLPFLVNDLAVIRTSVSATRDRLTKGSITLDDFLRSSAPQTPIESAETPDLVRVEKTDSMEQTWIGQGAPLGASKGMVQAFRNRLERSPADDDIDITVVCNAPEMDQERGLVHDVYGARAELPFDVDVRRELTRAELRDTLEEDVDFLHYIGHIDAAGFECADGRLDASTLDGTGVDVFLLNACASYQQGMHLIEHGAIAGIVTLQDVINSGAERIGYTLARLLNSGFPLRAALSLAKSRSIMGGHYLVIGDGGADLVQAEHGTPTLFHVQSTGRTNRVEMEAFPTQDRGMGTMFYPAIDGVTEQYLAAGRMCSFEMDDEALHDCLHLGDPPVLLDGQLCWKEEVFSG